MRPYKPWIKQGFWAHGRAPLQAPSPGYFLRALGALPPVGGDLLEQEAFQLSGIFQEVLQLSIGDAELQRLDAMMLQRDPQLIRLLSQVHLNVGPQMKEAEQVQFLLESCFEILFFQDWTDVRVGSLRV